MTIMNLSDFDISVPNFIRYKDSGGYLLSITDAFPKIRRHNYYDEPSPVALFVDEQSWRVNRDSGMESFLELAHLCEVIIFWYAHSPLWTIADHLKVYRSCFNGSSRFQATGRQCGRSRAS